VPLRQAPDRSLNGREKVVAKNDPFSLTFCQIVALMLPHRSVWVGFLLLVAILFPPLFEMKLALSGEEESQCTFQGGDRTERPSPACRRGTSSGSEQKLARAVRLAGASRSANRLQHQKPKALALKAPRLMRKINAISF